MSGRSDGWVSYSSQSTVSGAPIPGAVGVEGRPELADVGRLARRALRGAVAAARADERVTFSRLLLDHLGPAGADLAVVEERWRPYEHVNVQAGLDAWLDAPGRTHGLIGVLGFQHRMFGLAEMLRHGGEEGGYGLQPGNVSRVNLPCGPGGAVRPCVLCGVYLVGEGDRRAALLLHQSEHMPVVEIQAVSTEPGYAAEAIAEIRRLTTERNVFRGQVLSFQQEVFGPGQPLLHFHHRPTMQAAQLILAPGVLDALERQVVTVTRHKQQLLAAGQHIKRGVLLFGPPGVGKTHTVRYLVSSLTETTVIELSGNALHLVGEACSIARALQPAMLVVEDVDLIAEERGMHPGHHPLLFQLLNEMDGLDEDADIVFVLTTNRPDLLEPALAARPGRVDQAVELMLPDAAARRGLFDLYRGDLDVDLSRVEDVMNRTEGTTASFIKELLRRSAVLAADHADDSGSPDQPILVSADDLDAALDELLDTRNAMTRVLLGSAGSSPTPGVVPPGPGFAPWPHGR